MALPINSNSLNLPYGIYVSTDEDVDVKYRVADDSARDSLITYQLCKIGHVIYHVADNKRYVLTQYPTEGSLTGVIWEEIQSGGGGIPVISNWNPEGQSSEYPDTTGVSSGVWDIQGLSTEPYQFLTGDLTGQDVSNGNALLWNGISWSIIEDTQSLPAANFFDYYINNINDFITAYNDLQLSNYQGANFYITGNVILGNDIILNLRKSIKIIGLGGKIIFKWQHSTTYFDTWKFIIDVESSSGYAWNLTFKDIYLFGSDGSTSHNMTNVNTKTIIQVGTDSSHAIGAHSTKIVFDNVQFWDIVGGTGYTGVRNGVINYKLKLGWSTSLYFNNCQYAHHVGTTPPYTTMSLLPFGINHEHNADDGGMIALNVKAQKKHPDIQNDTGFDYEFVGNNFNGYNPIFGGDETAQCRVHNLSPSVQKSNLWLDLPISTNYIPDDYLFINESTGTNGAGNNIKKIKISDLPDSHNFNIIRTNHDLDIEPTSTEIPNPEDGDTGIILLSDSTVEFWSYNSGWSKDFMRRANVAFAMPSSDAEDVPPTGTNASVSDFLIKILDIGILEYWVNLETIGWHKLAKFEGGAGGGGHEIQENGAASPQEDVLNIITNGLEVVVFNVSGVSTDIELKFKANTDVDMTGVQDTDIVHYNAVTEKFEPNPSKVFDDILHSVEANVSADGQLSIIVPHGYKVDSVVITENSGNAAGDISIGNIASGGQVVSGQSILADDDIKATLVDSNGVYFSMVNDTDLFISSTAWGSSSVTVYFTMIKI